MHDEPALRELVALEAAQAITEETIAGRVATQAAFAQQPSLIADLPELGQRAGKRRARTSTGHDRPGFRRVLFNAARPAIRWNRSRKRSTTV